MSKFELATFATVGALIGGGAGGGFAHLIHEDNRQSRIITTYCEKRYDSTRYLSRAAINCMNNDDHIPGNPSGEVLDVSAHSGEIARPAYDIQPTWTEALPIGFGLLIGGGLGAVGASVLDLRRFNRGR